MLRRAYGRLARELVDLRDRLAGPRRPIARTDGGAGPDRVGELLEQLIAAPEPAVDSEIPPGRASVETATASPPTAGDAVQLVRQALAANRLDLYLQPIVSLPQRQVRYYECLSRMRDADGRVLTPESYLAAAASAGLVTTIDNLALFQSARLSQRRADSAGRPAFFCNVAPETLGDATFFGYLEAYLASRPELAELLIFELAAADLVGAPPLLRDRLKRLSNLGHRFSVDHVGSTDVEREALARLDVHFIKIDAAVLLAGDGQRPDGQTVSELRLALAQSGLHLIAAKVATEAEAAALAAAHVDLAQGYLLGPPRPANQLL